MTQRIDVRRRGLLAARADTKEGCVQIMHAALLFEPLWLTCGLTSWLAGSRHVALTFHRSGRIDAVG
jgi:hypothetical protein